MIPAADREALQDLLDGRLAPEQAAALQERLKKEPALARAYVALVREQVVVRRWAVAVAEVAPSGEAPPRPASPASPSPRRVIVAANLAAALLVVMGLTWYASLPGDRPTVPTSLARLEEVQGQVTVVSPEGKSIPAGVGNEIAAGSTVHVRGEASSAVMRYPDGTRLELGPGTSLRLQGDGLTAEPSPPAPKRLFLEEGAVTADVAAHPTGGPMVLTTPHAEITAAGSRFSSQSGAQATRLELDEGKAQVKRTSDGKAVELKSGSYVVATLQPAIFAPQVSPPRVTQPRLTIRDGAGPILALALTPDGKILANRSWDGAARLWDATTGQERAALTGHQKKVTCLAFSPDGKILATASEDKTIRLWDAQTGEPQAVWPAHKDLRALAFSPDGKLLAGAGAGKASAEIRLWDVAGGEEVGTLAGHTAAVQAVAFAPDGHKLASGSRDGTVRLWDTAARKELAVLEGHLVAVNGVAFSPDGKTLASAGQSGAVKLWDVGRGVATATFIHRGGSAAAVAFLPDGNTLASGGWGGTVSLWDLATGDESRIYHGHIYMVPCLAVSRDGRTLATGGWGDKTIKLWDLPAPKPQE